MIAASALLVLDGNLPVDTIKYAVDVASAASVHGKRHNMNRDLFTVWYEPTDASKMAKVFAAGCFHQLNTVSPNLAEFAALQPHLSFYDVQHGMDSFSLWTTVCSRIHERDIG